MTETEAAIMILPARPSDGARVGAVCRTAWLEATGVRVEAEADERFTAETFALFAEARCEEVVVAEIEGRVTGFAGTEPDDNYISDVWVAPDVESRGVVAASAAG